MCREGSIKDSRGRGKKNIMSDQGQYWLIIGYGYVWSKISLTDQPACDLLESNDDDGCGRKKLGATTREG